MRYRFGQRVQQLEKWFQYEVIDRRRNCSLDLLVAGHV